MRLGHRKRQPSLPTRELLCSIGKGALLLSAKGRLRFADLVTESDVGGAASAAPPSKPPNTSAGTGAASERPAGRRDRLHRRRADDDRRDDSDDV